jgi:CBS domain-containing protein
MDANYRDRQFAQPQNGMVQGQGQMGWNQGQFGSSQYGQGSQGGMGQGYGGPQYGYSGSQYGQGSQGGMGQGYGHQFGTMGSSQMYGGSSQGNLGGGYQNFSGPQGNLGYGQGHQGHGGYGQQGFGQSGQGFGEGGYQQQGRFEQGRFEHERQGQGQFGHEDQRFQRQGQGQRSNWQREPLSASEVMTKNVMTATKQTPLKEIAKLMKDENVGIIPVVDEQHRLLGVVTDRDIVTRLLAQGKDISSAKAEDVMTDDIEAVTPDESIHDVLSAMGDKHVRRVPVVDKNDRLLGIISLSDLASRADSDEELQHTLGKISAKRSFWSRMFG